MTAEEKAENFLKALQEGCKELEIISHDLNSISSGLDDIGLTKLAKRLSGMGAAISHVSARLEEEYSKEIREVLRSNEELFGDLVGKLGGSLKG